MVKNALADFSAENFEIASYNALIAACEQIGDMQTVSACRQILQQEIDMANWLQQNLPGLVQTTLAQMTAPAAR